MPLAWRLLVIGALLFMLMPLLVLLAGSLQFPEGSWSLGNYAQLAGDGRQLLLLARSLALAAATTLACLSVGVPVAVLAAKTDLPGRQLWLALFSAPLALPSYVFAQGWFRLLGKQGIGASEFLFSLSGAVLVLMCALLPITILLTAAGLSFVPPALEDAGRIAAPWPRVLASITLPLARPAIATAALITFLLALGDYGAPAFLRVSVFPVESFTQISAFYDPGAAAAAWAPLLLIVALAVVAGRSNLATFQRSHWSFGASQPAPLGRWRYVALTGVVGGSLLFVVLPVAALAAQGVSASAVRDAWPLAWDGLAWSALDSGLAATLVCAVGFIAARYPPAVRLDCVGLGAFALFAVPGPLLAFAMAVAWNRPSFARFYGSPALLVCALAIQYVAVGVLAFRAALAQLSPSLESAAEVAGAGWWMRTRTIVWPLVGRTAIVVWLLTFVLCIRDTSLPLQLSPPGQDPLTARTLTLAANGSDQTIAALCLFSVLLAIAPLTILWAPALRGRHRA
jgi:iron(III) transport system permease protein